MSKTVKYSPVTGELLGEFPNATADEVTAVVAQAREAFGAWRAMPLEVRLNMLGRIKDVIRDHGEAYAERISRDTGKPLVDSLMTELMSVPLFLDYYKREAPKLLKRKSLLTPLVLQPKRSYTEHAPMGVIAVISPWNFPFQLSMVPVISALIAGNTVVLKPSEVTPLTGEVIAEIFERSGLPAGVFNLVFGDGSTGAALCEADVDKIFFTGSVETGRKVMTAAAKKPIPVELELGGKDAMIVCHDANLRRAAKGAIWGSMINCGQMCISVERLFVVDSIYDEFVGLLRKELAKVRVGAPEDDADMGPLTFGKQLDTVRQHVEDAERAGAGVEAHRGPLPEQGQFYAPTLLTDITPEMEIYREETFGPVLPIIRVRDEEEAIGLANDHKFGLTGSVWTTDIERGLALASRMECGQVNVNDVVLATGNPVLPFGGVKNSGFGRYHGAEGLYAFMNQKSIMVDRGRGEAEPFWFPYRGKYPYMRKIFHALLADRPLRAVGSLLKLKKMSA